MESQLNISKTFGSFLQPNLINSAPNSQAPNALGEAVQKFEAFFIQSMLKSMRQASLSSGLLESDKSNFYRDWHDQQLADNLAAKETFAVAKLLRNQFTEPSDTTAQGSPLSSSSLFQRSNFSSVGAESVPKVSHPATLVASVGTPSGSIVSHNKTNLKQLVTKEIKENNGISDSRNTTPPEQFVELVYPHAQRAATKLNTSADVLIAIAALETGWGLHTPKAKDVDSNNYFGIKANNWQGRVVNNITREFNGEKMIELKDTFRAYESPADSFNDFAEFLLSNPRYQSALEKSADSNSFVEELQKAGYATDPNYAKKILSILSGSILKNAIHSLPVSIINEKVVSNIEIN